MTRKHYIELAKIIGRAQGAADINRHNDIDEEGHGSCAISNLTGQLLALLKDENPAFDGGRFLQAVADEANDLVDEAFEADPWH